MKTPESCGSLGFFLFGPTLPTNRRDRRGAYAVRKEMLSFTYWR